MPSLSAQFSRFRDERRYLVNVTPKTLVWYAEADLDPSAYLPSLSRIRVLDFEQL